MTFNTAFCTQGEQEQSVNGTAIITHKDCQLHDMGFSHPEAPARLNAIADHLIAQRLAPHLAYYEAPLASTTQLLRVHSAAYLQHLQASAPKEGIVYLDPDTAMCPHTWQAALRAAGAGAMAVDLIMASEIHSAFCAVRPPGHHAERAKAMGFCFFNNIAVAVTHALAEYKFARVAIVDFDVHHGNGTEHCFQGNEQVLMTGTFQHPFYPYSGTHNPAPNICNVPLPAGADGELFRQAMNEVCLPRLRAFAPEMIFISAGFDAHYEDGLGNMKLLEEDYAWVTRQIRQIAEETAQGRIVSLLEGGYSLSALGRSVAAHVGALAGIR